MSRPKPKYVPEPRVLSAFQVATRLGRSEGWFSENREMLEDDKGFPRRNAFLNGWDAVQVEQWLDKQFGLDNAFASPDAELEKWEPFA